MYLKIVPAEQEISSTHVMECDRIDYRVEQGAATEVCEAIERGLSPNCGPDGAEPVRTIRVGYCRTVLEPGTSLISAALITVYQEDKPLTLVAAYECSIYLMNDKGITVDKIRAHYKF